MAVAQSVYALLVAAGVVGQIINGETSNRISRTVETAAGLPFGQPAFRGAGDHGVVIGGTFAATGAGSAAAGNVGTGVMTASPAITAGAKSGRYTAVLTGTSATAPYIVYDPDGNVAGHGVVATANTTIPGITTFTISNAGTMTAGDTFFIDVTYTANVKFMGLAILDHVVPAVGAGGVPDQYPQYYTAALMTMGQMVVTAGATVADGDDVYWNPATKRYTNTATHVRIPNCKFDMDSTDGNLVVIGLKTRIV